MLYLKGKSPVQNQCKINTLNGNKTIRHVLSSRSTFRFKRVFINDYKTDLHASRVVLLHSYLTAKKYAVILSLFSIYML